MEHCTFLLLTRDSQRQKAWVYTSYVSHRLKRRPPFLSESTSVPRDHLQPQPSRPSCLPRATKTNQQQRTPNRNPPQNSMSGVLNFHCRSKRQKRHSRWTYNGTEEERMFRFIRRTTISPIRFSSSGVHHTFHSRLLQSLHTHPPLTR